MSTPSCGDENVSRGFVTPPSNGHVAGSEEEESHAAIYTVRMSLVKRAPPLPLSMSFAEENHKKLKIQAITKGALLGMLGSTITSLAL